MSDYKVGLRIEQYELQQKINKLRDFCNTYEPVDEIYRDDNVMIDQLTAMDNYNDCLRLRLADMGEPLL